MKRIRVFNYRERGDWMIENVKKTMRKISNMPVKGKVKIELFDELTGEKLEEISGENFISKNVHRYWMLQMKEIFNGGMGLNKTFKPNINYFNTMFLSAEAYAEDINQVDVLDKIVGYANTEYVGTDTFRGSLNKTESYVNDERFHYVFDFPTQAANDVPIQSIFFSSDLGESGYFRRSSLQMNSFGFGKKKQLEALYPLAVDDKYIYTSKDKKIYITDKNTFELIKEFDVLSGIYDFSAIECANGILYGFYRFDSYGVYRIDLDGTQTLIKTLDFRPGSSARYYDGKFYILEYGTKNIRVTDMNFNTIDIMSISDRYFCIYKGHFLHDYENTIRTLNGDLIGVWDIGTARSLATDGTYIYASYGDGFKVLDIRTLGSRYLLESPVVKTSTNTMKITYDFILPPIF